MQAHWLLQWFSSCSLCPLVSIEGRLRKHSPWHIEAEARDFARFVFGIAAVDLIARADYSDAEEAVSLEELIAKAFSQSMPAS